MKLKYIGQFRKPRSAGERIDPQNVRVDGKPLEFLGPLYVLFHKPKGYECARSLTPMKRVKKSLNKVPAYIEEVIEDDQGNVIEKQEKDNNIRDNSEEIKKKIVIRRTNDEDENEYFRKLSKGTIFEFFPIKWIRRNPLVHSVGRLDKDCSGLLIITDNGKLSFYVSSPKSGISKTYRVTTKHPLQDLDREILASGQIVFKNEKTPCKPAILKIIPPSESILTNLNENYQRSPNRDQESREALITVIEGKFHHVKKLFTALNNKVLTIHREKIGELSLGDLKEGEWRVIQNHEWDLIDPSKKILEYLKQKKVQTGPSKNKLGKDEDNENEDDNEDEEEDEEEDENEDEDYDEDEDDDDENYEKDENKMNPK